MSLDGDNVNCTNWSTLRLVNPSILYHAQEKMIQTSISSPFNSFSHRKRKLCSSKAIFLLFSVDFGTWRKFFWLLEDSPFSTWKEQRIQKISRSTRHFSAFELWTCQWNVRRIFIIFSHSRESWKIVFEFFFSFFPSENWKIKTKSTFMWLLANFSHWNSFLVLILICPSARSSPKVHQENGRLWMKILFKARIE